LDISLKLFSDLWRVEFVWSDGAGLFGSGAFAARLFPLGVSAGASAGFPLR